MAEWIKALAASEIPKGGAKKIEVGTKEIALFNVDGTFFAMDEMCPHRGGPLSEGQVEGGVVSCPWHGWEFEVKTGISPVNPAACVHTYPVRVDGSDVFISV